MKGVGYNSIEPEQYDHNTRFEGGRFTEYRNLIGTCCLPRPIQVRYLTGIAIT
jgi:hypothetical protein